MGDAAKTASRTAAARIREHQQAPGYWLTAFTSAPRFEQPAAGDEHLSHVAARRPARSAAGRGGSRRQRAARPRASHRARSRRADWCAITDVPDAPGIGTLGCAITPDTDDTALVWRIAPGRDRSAAAGRAGDDRRAIGPRDGLYRTWLAPREAYQCLDPGSDPNPADIAIQMHLLLLLAEVRPPAGRALCDALRRHRRRRSDLGLLRMAPLVPILRLTDLRARRLRAGAARVADADDRARPGDLGVRRPAAGARGRSPSPPADAAEIRRCCASLASDDFALVRKSPPLLYHNDLTATVPAVLLVGGRRLRALAKALR